MDEMSEGQLSELHEAVVEGRADLPKPATWLELAAKLAVLSFDAFLQTMLAELRAKKTKAK